MHKTNSLSVRFLDESDYTEIASWFSRRGWDCPPLWQHLPKGDRAIGVVNGSDNLLACGFVYLTETPLTILEWTATNPDQPLKICYKAVRLVLEAAKIVAKTYRPEAVLIQFLVHSGLKKLYKREGFLVGDANLTSMIWGGK
jgi:hypothetical protein